MQPYYDEDGITIYNGDFLEVAKSLEGSSFNLIIEDPPYFRVKNDYWDNQWDTTEGFLEWLDVVLQEQLRLLAFNGGQYTFASPQMAARVEIKIAEYFNVLNHIVWRKYNDKTGKYNSGQWTASNKEGLRAYFPQTERIIFAEHINCDCIAVGENKHRGANDKLNEFIYEPLRSYIAGEWEMAGLNDEDLRLAVKCAPGSGLPHHYFGTSQWILPTKKKYLLMREYANKTGGSFYERPYAELKAEREKLKLKFEELRRPFFATPDSQYTDVWDFRTVSYYEGKHPCEKPLDLMEHIIKMSSRESDIILDPFMGSGTTLVAAKKLGRHAIGIDLEKKYCDLTIRRLRGEQERNMQISLL